MVSECVGGVGGVGGAGGVGGVVEVLVVSRLVVSRCWVVLR